uniref:Uncharacterized protein n=1 Tax=Chromulina nebulosa TaxID=96789 RepID=A0A7S0XBJ2_9STRA|mmetsp:Transcript_1191/g.1049  ORF Transcript_1191/g.1049 Transcript_1191/m.1049 type:complete len:825 (+) Transcript_1191:128-2602(+)
MNRDSQKSNKSGQGLIRSGLSVQELKAITALRVGAAHEIGDKSIVAAQKLPQTGVRSYQTANPNQLVAAGMLLQSSVMSSNSMQYQTTNQTRTNNYQNQVAIPTLPIDNLQSPYKNRQSPTYSQQPFSSSLSPSGMTRMVSTSEIMAPNTMTSYDVKESNKQRLNRQNDNEIFSDSFLNGMNDSYNSNNNMNVNVNQQRQFIQPQVQQNHQQSLLAQQQQVLLQQQQQQQQQQLNQQMQRVVINNNQKYSRNDNNNYTINSPSSNSNDGMFNNINLNQNYNDVYNNTSNSLTNSHDYIQESIMYSNQNNNNNITSNRNMFANLNFDDENTNNRISPSRNIAMKSLQQYNQIVNDEPILSNTLSNTNTIGSNKQRNYQQTSSLSALSPLRNANPTYLPPVSETNSQVNGSQFNQQQNNNLLDNIYERDNNTTYLSNNQSSISNTRNLSPNQLNFQPSSNPFNQSTNNNANTSFLPSIASNKSQSNNSAKRIQGSANFVNPIELQSESISDRFMSLSVNQSNIYPNSNNNNNNSVNNSNVNNNMYYSANNNNNNHEILYNRPNSESLPDNSLSYKSNNNNSGINNYLSNPVSTAPLNYRSISESSNFANEIAESVLDISNTIASPDSNKYRKGLPSNTFKSNSNNYDSNNLNLGRPPGILAPLGRGLSNSMISDPGDTTTPQLNYAKSFKRLNSTNEGVHNTQSPPGLIRNKSLNQHGPNYQQQQQDHNINGNININDKNNIKTDGWLSDRLENDERLYNNQYSNQQTQLFDSNYGQLEYSDYNSDRGSTIGDPEIVDPVTHNLIRNQSMQMPMSLPFKYEGDYYQ